MNKVVEEWAIQGYTILTLDEKKPKRGYWKYIIDGEVYEYVPMTNIENCIAIKSPGRSLLGKTVEYVYEKDQ